MPKYPYRVLGSFLDRIFRNNLNDNFKDIQSDLEEQKGRVDNLIVSNPQPSEVQDARGTFPVLRDRLNQVDASLADIATDLKNFPIQIPEIDDTGRFNRAIQSIQTTEYTEAIPTQGAKGKILVPAGLFKISSKITVPSYVSIEGNGRNTTIIQSSITNGDPVFDLIQGDGTNRQFYNSVKKLTIDGQGNACVGIRIYDTSRWVLDELLINNTLNEGLIFYNACLGEVRSVLVRACGNASHYSVKYDGPNSNLSSNSVTWLGGEVNGGGTSVNGIDILYGNTLSFFGTTIEGFANGLGVLNENGQSVTIMGCHFEANKGHIKNVTAYNPVIIGNFLAQPSAGAAGYIIIKNMYGGKIEGNFMPGTGFTHIVANDAASVLQYASVKDNYVSAYPVVIDPILVSSALAAGTIIETFDANGHVVTYGQRQMHDGFETLGTFKPTGGFTNISGKVGVNLLAGTGTPQGAVTAYPGALFLRSDGAVDTSIYIKNSGVNSLYGWVPLQPVMVGTTAQRPTVTSVGFQYYDTTLYKPIWFAGGGIWKDATGTNV